MPIQSEEFVDALRREIGAEAFRELEAIKRVRGFRSVGETIKYVIMLSHHPLIRGKGTIACDK